MSRRDDERVADTLDAASEIGEVIELGRDAWDKDRIGSVILDFATSISPAGRSKIGSSTAGTPATGRSTASLCNPV